MHFDIILQVLWAWTICREPCAHFQA